MKILKIVSAVMLIVFAFYAAGFCGEMTEDDFGHHCIASCHTGCCSAVSQNQQLHIPPAPVTMAVFLQKTPHQFLFVDDIDHPPKTSCSYL